jgi:hypothetical protein
MKERVDFVGHKIISSGDTSAILEANNIIIPAKNESQLWLKETTEHIGEWRAKFRSAYIKWAMCINSIYKAIDRYSEDDFKKNNKFYIESFRIQKDSTIRLTKIALWNGDEVADRYLLIIPSMAENGIIEMYGAIEEYIFSIYKIFLNHNPSALLRGPEYSELRKLYRKKDESSELLKEWSAKWEGRLNSWYRKKAYDGIKKIFNSYLEASKLSKGNLEVELSGLADSLHVVAYLRNLLVHNEPLVTEELAVLTKQNYCPFPNIFIKDEKLAPDLSTLMGIENMCDSILTVINLSCIGVYKKRIY